MKNSFSNCFALLYICLHCGEVCICWHFGAPGTPGFYVRAQHDPEKNEIYLFFSFFFILTQKVLIRLLLYLTCKLLLNRGYICEPRWAQSDYSSTPPPPPPPPSWQFSTSGFNIRFPKMKKCSSDYFHILHIVEFWCDFKMFVGIYI